MPLVVCFELWPGHLVFEFHESLTDGIGLELHVWDGWAWLVTDDGSWVGAVPIGEAAGHQWGRGA